MGWFNEQIKQRKQLDDEVFSDSFVHMAEAVLGEKSLYSLKDDSERIKDSINEILGYYHLKPREIPDGIEDVNEQLEYLMRPYGFMRRMVELSPGWHRDAIGAMLTKRTDDGSAVALIPSGLSGYSYFDVNTGKRQRVTRRNEALFEGEAIAFYKPFPLRKLKVSDLVSYMLGMISVSDLVCFAGGTFAVTLVGLLLPKLQRVLFGNVIDSGSMGLLTVTAVFMICVTVSRTVLEAVKTLFSERINTKLDVSIEAATMMRVLSLPAPFFKGYSSGELSSRVGNIRTLCEMLVSSMLSVGLTSVFSLTYITQLVHFGRSLVLPALGILLATTVFSILSTLVRLRIVKERMELSAKESGMSYALISGMQKIKLSGSEKRAFSRWGELFAKESSLTYNPPAFIKLNSVISVAISLIGTLVLYSEAAVSGISSADYIAFTAAFGAIQGAFAGIAGIAQNLASIKPTLDMAKPVLETEPEVSEGKEVISRLAGGIEINNVSFRYSENQPIILDDISLKIRPGQYVAIVGRTGCGKSTLMRLLLGFEKPMKGAIYYDGKDINSIDLKSLRRRIGVVMQEGRLFQGDLYSNIVISAPWLTLDDAWEAAEMAGIAEDIRRMPMGMHTLVSEGSGGISGGQRQRLMIARAIAPKPKVLMFDEATSALDNITQKKVSESLDSLKCTRIVIAHRLSTIRHCDRIICLDGGRIIEDGTYDELIAKNGFFAELVSRQRIDRDA